MTTKTNGAYGVDNDLVDYILGITYEIWEQRRIDLIDQYYGREAIVYCLDGIVHGSKAMIDGTNSMLSAYPDRLLLGDDVITAGDTANGYSSHRVLSPMTNRGNSVFGGATGKQVRIMNMADCVVENGLITGEWLARDNLALVTQLGFDPVAAAESIAANQTKELREWFSDEGERLSESSENKWPDEQRLLDALWLNGDKSIIDSSYAEYAVLHRSPIELHSGLPALATHYAQLRGAFKFDAATIDSVCSQAAGDNATHVATRWAVCGHHQHEYLGIAASGRPVYIMGVTHRRIVDGRIAVEWTVFDSLAVMAQLI